MANDRFGGARPFIRLWRQRRHDRDPTRSRGGGARELQSTPLAGLLSGERADRAWDDTRVWEVDPHSTLPVPAATPVNYPVAYSPDAAAAPVLDDRYACGTPRSASPAPPCLTLTSWRTWPSAPTAWLATETTVLIEWIWEVATARSQRNSLPEQHLHSNGQHGRHQSGHDGK